MMKSFKIVIVHSVFVLEKQNNVPFSIRLIIIFVFRSYHTSIKHHILQQRFCFVSG